jgi:hypothetical protein
MNPNGRNPYPSSFPWDIVNGQDPFQSPLFRGSMLFNGRRNPNITMPPPFSHLPTYLPFERNDNEETDEDEELKRVIEISKREQKNQDSAIYSQPLVEEPSDVEFERQQILRNVERNLNETQQPATPINIETSFDNNSG